MAVQEQDVERIYGCARALFQEKKAISIEDVTEYMRTVANAPMLVADIEECLTRLFDKSTGNNPAVELHQAFLFRHAAVGYWLGTYRILVLQVRAMRGEEKQAFLAYPIYGVPEDGTAKLIGIATQAKHVLEFLTAQGVEISRWFPLEDWEKLVSGKREEILKELATLSSKLSETMTVGQIV